MKKLIFFTAVLLGFTFLLSGLGQGKTVSAQQTIANDPRFVPNELIISIKIENLPFLQANEISSADLGDENLTRLALKFNVYSAEAVFSQNNESTLDQSGMTGVFLLKAADGTNLRLMKAAFEADPNIEYAEYNRYVYAVGVTPNDPQFSKQWALKNAYDHDIDADQAWAIEKGKPGTLIAVIDTGVLYTHPDLKGSRMRKDIDYDFVNNDNNAIDDHGHGTHVAGIIAATGNNGKGIAGICMGCSILPIKVLDSQGAGTASSVASGIQYAADKGADIINMSLGIAPDCGCSKTIAKAINYAFNKGSLLIAASGNNGQSKISYPASSSRVMSIGATNIDDVKTSWSNYGKKLDLVAPGNNILSTYLNNTYKAFSGTSMAAPHASGVAGLVESKRPSYNNRQIWWVLRVSADDLGPDGYDIRYGRGRLNAYRALKITNPQKQLTPVDQCNQEPSSGCGDCTLKMAVGYLPSATSKQNLKTLYQFRDNALKPTTTGSRWIEYFETYTVEVSGILYSDPQMQRQTVETFALWMPAIKILAEDSPEKFIVTRTHMEALVNLRNAFLERGSEKLANDILLEWNKLNLDNIMGQEIHVVWRQIKNIR